MQTAQITALRKEGKLEEALTMAREAYEKALAAIDIEQLNAEVETILEACRFLHEQRGEVYQTDVERIKTKGVLMNHQLEWEKRNLAWVYFEYIKKYSSVEYYKECMVWLEEVKKCNFSSNENMFFEQLAWQIGKLAFSIVRSNSQERIDYTELFAVIREFNFPKQTESYSFLFKALHKLLKDTDSYIHFADWWDFKNFRHEDFQKEKMSNGREIMAIAEQAYIAYAKHLLPKREADGNIIFNKEKTLAFLPLLEVIVENYPQYQYPGYFQAKLLLALGDNAEHVLAILLPFVKRKRNDFWAWDVLSEVYKDDEEKVHACYCKALSLRSPQEMLVNLRQRMATIFINKKLFNEAKTEIEHLSAARGNAGWSLPNIVRDWMQQEWYVAAQANKSNTDYYAQYSHLADELLYNDKPEETVIVDFVNTDRKILNFIASESQYGFFKYERFLSDVKIGDILKVRFQAASHDGMHQLYTAIKVNDDAFSAQFMKEVSGIVKIPAGKHFGFMDDVFIHPSLVTRYKLIDGMQFTGKAIKSFNREKKQWGWKLL